MSFRRNLRIGLAIILVVQVLAACSGSDGGAGATGATGPAGPSTPQIYSLVAEPAVVRPGQNTVLSVSASDAGGATLTYTWSAPGGSLSATNTNPVTWTAPGTVGSQLVSVQVGNGSTTATGYASILVSVAPAGPVVTSVSPAQARAGQEVLISGAGFGASQGASTLAIGGANATSITSWSETQIRAIVPAGAATGAVIATVGGAASSPGYLAVLWPTEDGVALSQASGNQSYPSAVSDGSGGAIVVWRDGRSGTDSDIYAQRVSSTGIALWAANGVAITAVAGSNQDSPEVIADGSGGAIVVWSDARDSATTGTDIYAQRLDSAGIPQWTANGVAVSTATGNQLLPRLASDGSGGAIIAWADYRSGTFSDIYAQRLNGAGVPQWTMNGVAICNAAGEQSPPRLVADGSGGVIMVWYDYRSGSDWDIYAQRVGASGLTQWSADGVAVSTAGSDQIYPQLTSDGNGGAIIAWSDWRSGEGDIYAQHLNGAGTAQWTANGMTVSVATSLQHGTRVAADGSGGAVIAWMDLRNGIDYDVYAQRVTGAGATLWAADGQKVSTAAGDQEYPDLASDGSGGAIIAWRDRRQGSPGSGRVYAQRLNGHGEPQWAADGIASTISRVTDFAASYSGPWLVAGIDGGAILFWHDIRDFATTGYDIYAQGVTADGMR